MKRKICILILAICLIVSAPITVLAAEKNVSEVIIDSNALNSSISLKVNEEVASGPGSQVYTEVAPSGTFVIVAEPTEESYVESVDLQAQLEDGTTLALSPIASEEDTYTYTAPSQKAAIIGQVVFGEKSAVAASEQTQEARESVQPEEAAKAEASEETSETVAPVTAVGESPYTGVKDTEMMFALSLCVLLIAGVALFTKSSILVSHNGNRK